MRRLLQQVANRLIAMLPPAEPKVALGWNLNSEQRMNALLTAIDKAAPPLSIAIHDVESYKAWLAVLEARDAFPKHLFPREPS